MGRENARTHFSRSEMERIETLVAQLEKAPADKQKGIRGKIRKIGLYWSEVAGGRSYTVQNLRQLVRLGIIQVDGQLAAEPIIQSVSAPGMTVLAGGRKNSDEQYVIDLCNEALGLRASQQHTFPFLLGDSGRPLPVDAYYQDLNLVVEYYERQHTEAVKLFDRRMTVSGVSRGEQRKIYDERRKTELPKHGIVLVILDYSDFGTTKKLVRNHNADLQIVKNKLNQAGFSTQLKSQ